MFESIAQTSSTGGGDFVGSAAWIADAMTGTVATIVATLAVAALGFASLLGRLSVKDAGRVALGCFIFFGAPYIARELAPAARQEVQTEAVFSAPLELMPDVPSAPQPNHDPYAGASVPMP